MGPLESIWVYFGQLLISRGIEKGAKERKDRNEGTERNKRKEET